MIAAGGYPAQPEAGRVIAGIDRAVARPDVLVFHAGTRRVGQDLVTAGGRVLTIVGRGGTFAAARAAAYGAVDEIQFDGMQYRRDIGNKAVEGA